MRPASLGGIFLGSGVRVAFVPDVADVVALRAVILFSVFRAVRLGFGKDTAYPGDNLNKVGLGRHAKNVRHAIREIETSVTV